MITNNDIKTPELFREKLLEILADNDDKIYPINNFFKHCFNTKSHALINNFVREHSSSSILPSYYDTLFRTYFPDDNVSDSSDLWQEHNASYIFVGSTSNFATLFDALLPSTYSIVFNYLVNNSYIIPVSKGYVRGILFSNSIFISDFSDLSLTTPFDDMQGFLTHVQNIENDKSYLLDKVNERDAVIESLKLELSTIQNRTIMRSLMTWS
jgi:hypothetical protein